MVGKTCSLWSLRFPFFFFLPPPRDITHCMGQESGSRCALLFVSFLLEGDLPRYFLACHASINGRWRIGTFVTSFFFGQPGFSYTCCTAGGPGLLYLTFRREGPTIFLIEKKFPQSIVFMIPAVYFHDEIALGVRSAVHEFRYRTVQHNSMLKCAGTCTITQLRNPYHIMNCAVGVVISYIPDMIREIAG